MNKFILLILVMLISGVAAVKTDAKALETALGVMVLIEKVKQFCGKKPEGAIAITLPFGLLTQLYLRYSCVSRPSASDQKNTVLAFAASTVLP